MTEVFLEVVIDAADAAAVGIDSRDEVEDPLIEALRGSGVAEVSGGGGGSGVYVIDVDVESEERFVEALELIRKTLRSLNVPPSSRIKRSRPGKQEFEVYGLK